MISRRIAIGLLSLFLLGYTILITVEYKLSLAAKINTVEDNRLSIKSRYLFLREIDPNIQIVKKGRTGSFSADSNGFINPSGSHKTPDLNIIFLGGSTTKCLKVDEKFRFPYLVGHYLELKTSLKINSFNGGRAGNNGLNSYVRLLNVALPLKPDYAFLMHNINDLVHLIYTNSYWSTSNKHRLMVSTFDSTTFYPQDVSFYFKDQYFFPNTIKALKKIKSKVLNQPQTVNEWENTQKLSIKIDTNQIFKDFTSAIEMFVHTCKAWNIEPILMTQQNSILNEEEHKNLKAQLIKRGLTMLDFKNMYIRANTIIREIAIKNQIDLIDLDQNIPKTTEYMYDFVHFNNEGSILAAKIISDSLLIKINPPL